MSPGRSTVACWMNPTMSNCEATAGTCAVVGTVSAVAIVTATSAHATVSLPGSGRACRCTELLRITMMCSAVLSGETLAPDEDTRRRQATGVGDLRQSCAGNSWRPEDGEFARPAAE